MSSGFTLKDASHRSWLQDKKGSIDSYYWSRYKRILQSERSKDVVAKTDIVTDEILDLLSSRSEIVLEIGKYKNREFGNSRP